MAYNETLLQRRNLMGKIKSALSMIGSMAEAYAERDTKIRELTKVLHAKTYGVDYEDVKAVATVLVDNVDEIVWK
jgi:hypothetical protein